MAHPDHDQVIGRLIGARLRGPAGRRPGGTVVAEAHPDAETWAAYLDGGLLPAEVTSLDDHLSGCASCRRLVAAIAPEVSAGVVAATGVAEAPAPARATVIPFPRRHKILAWVTIAAALFLTVTLWSVPWRGRNAPILDMAERAPVAEPAPTASAPTAPAATERSAIAPTATVVSPAPVPADRLAARKRSEQSRDESATAAGAVGGTPPAETARSGATAEEDKRLADAAPPAARTAAPAAAPAANARQIPLQTNAIAVGAARPHGPLANQAANQQQNAPASQASAAPTPSTPVTPVAIVAAPPAPAAAPARAQAEAGAARERRGNEQQAGQLAESVAATGGRAGSRADAATSARAGAAVAGADRDAASPAKDELAKAAFATPLPSFAEPGGRLQWRIAEGRRLESSSDAGVTWTARFTTGRGDRLRAGAAPAIDSAWAVGERGLVLRLSVPGGWTAVARPDAAALVAVSATDGRSARVTTADGRVFETADGGATWTPAPPGGPQ